MDLPLGGTHALLVTPFDDDGRLDKGSLAALVDFVLDGGVQGVVALGTTGEFFTLGPAERVEVMQAVVDAVAGRAHVTIGVGGDATSVCVELAGRAREIGADCLMAVPPYYFDLTPAAQMRHFTAIALSAELPIMLYDGAGGIPVPVEVIKMVTEAAPNVRYVKLALPDPSRVADLVSSLPGLCPLAGDDVTLVAALRAGARASAIATGCIQPREVVTVHEAVNAGRLDEAVSTFAATLAPSLLATSTPKHQFIARFKEVLHAMGVLASPRVRSPLGAITAEEREELLSVMRHLKVL